MTMWLCTVSNLLCHWDMKAGSERAMTAEGHTLSQTHFLASGAEIAVSAIFYQGLFKKGFWKARHRAITVETAAFV